MKSYWAPSLTFYGYGFGVRVGKFSLKTPRSVPVCSKTFTGSTKVTRGSPPLMNRSPIFKVSRSSIYRPYFHGPTGTVSFTFNRVENLLGMTTLSLSQRYTQLFFPSVFLRHPPSWVLRQKTPGSNPVPKELGRNRHTSHHTLTHNYRLTPVFTHFQSRRFSVPNNPRLNFHLLRPLWILTYIM